MRRACLLALLLTPAACVQLEDYTGTWSGSVLADDAVRAGFAPETTATLELDVRGRSDASGTLTTEGTGIGRFVSAELVPWPELSADALSTLVFDGADFVNYLFFARPEGGDPALVVVSLDPEERVALRVLRGEDLFGVFPLGR